MKAQKWVLVQHFEGEPKNEDLQLVQEDLPEELNENGKSSIIKVISLQLF